MDRTPRNRWAFSFLLASLYAVALLTLGACGDSSSGPEATPPEESTEWAAWLHEHGNVIASLTSPDFTDLQFLKPLIGGRRIVQLGECGHGVAQFNTAKVRLIKFLHGERGGGGRS